VKWFWENRNEMSKSMNELYRIIGTSKQGFHQWLKREEQRTQRWSFVSDLVIQVRKDHPGMGIRTIWEMMKPAGIGRNEFEEMAMLNGLGIEVKKNYQKTTDSYGAIWIDNLIDQIRLTRLNQVWVSDITYYLLDSRFYYITLIMDLYSRKIVGHSASKTLMTDHTTLPALRYAIKRRQITAESKGLIFHSDAGGQYRQEALVRELNELGIKRSMAKSAYENAHAERLNRTIKQQYIYLYGPRSFKEFKRDVDRACLNYNEERPHQSLKKMSPSNFESQLNQRKVINISTIGKY